MCSFGCAEIEKWKAVRGYEGIYEISSMSRVKMLSRVTVQNRVIPGRLKATQTKQNGYRSVGLTNGSGKITSYWLHRLVAKNFIPNPDNLPQINHLDGKKAHNCVSNLEWATPAQNVAHGIKLGIIDPHRGHKIRCLNNGIVYKSFKAAARSLGISDGLVRLAVIGEITSAKGWKFRLEDGSPLVAPSEKLNACPFCGDRSKLIFVFSREFTHVECIACFVNGPRGANEEAATNKWNARMERT